MDDEHSTSATMAMATEGLLWFGLGVGCVLAYRLTVHQLESFKAQCEIPPDETRETVDKATENALKLDTLATLSRGVNYNLSRAAIRIIAERAVADDTLPTLLRRARSLRRAPRRSALKILRFLILGKPKSDNYYENDNDHILSKDSEVRLHHPSVFKALVTACTNSLPRTEPPHPRLGDDVVAIPRDEESEAYALESLRALLRRGGPDAATRALQAGLVRYMRDIPMPSPHANIVSAFNDREYQPGNYFLYDIHDWLLGHDETGEYLKQLKRAGLFEQSRLASMEPCSYRTTGSFDHEVQMFQQSLGEPYPASAAALVEEALDAASTSATPVWDLLEQQQEPREQEPPDQPESWVVV
ncbi:hypothetical protein Dda_7568 [Drechslerella dactyloides]|uniref:Uncharacterized protein n=1 Tax=Drechslerella dactyloides TaxID=74499 RepID=A0AAD6ITK9_DREDA|nr:hypothetical protein Dda_7568 [Drechslerella dactyloides]